MCLDADDYCPCEKTPGQLYDDWVHEGKEPKGDLDPLHEKVEEFLRKNRELSTDIQEMLKEVEELNDQV